MTQPSPCASAASSPSEHALPRRGFFGAATLVGASAAFGLWPRKVQAAPFSPAKGAVILFQGDSITDAGRDRKREGRANQSRSLGTGYPLLISGALLESHRDLDLKCYNRGISGNKVPDLEARWDTDALDLKPALISILIGVNDLWHSLNGRYDGTAADYLEQYRALIARTQKALPDTTLVVCQPFVLRCGAVDDSWFPAFDERRAHAKTVAEEAGAIWVPFQDRFDEAVASGTDPAYWAEDGVHPSPAGHALMAKTWRESVGL